MNSRIVKYSRHSIKKYTSIVCRTFLNDLIKDNIITFDDKNKDVKDILYIEPAVSDKLDYAIEHSEKAIKKLEYWEFIKNYKYSTLYKIIAYDKDSLIELVKKGKVLDYGKIEGFEELYSNAIKPSYNVIDDKIYIKFNYALYYKDNMDNELYQRYPVCVIIDIEKKILEYRFDGITYNNDRAFELFRQVHEWITNQLKIKIVNLEIKTMFKQLISMGEYKNAYISTQKMLMENGTVATVSVGTNEEGVLPFIGELRALLRENEEQFNKAPDTKKIIEDFLEEKIKLSDYPKMNIRFKDRGDLEVQITFSYDGKGTDLIHHYTSVRVSNIGKERMEYVTNFIINSKREIGESKQKDKAVDQ